MANIENRKCGMAETMHEGKIESDEREKRRCYDLMNEASTGGSWERKDASEYFGSPEYREFREELYDMEQMEQDECPRARTSRDVRLDW